MRPARASDPGSRQASGRPRFGGTASRLRCPIPVGPSDEVALIPPVSGGADAVRGSVVDTSALTGVIAVLVLIGANIADGLAWWAAALVAVAAGWVIDLGDRLASRGPRHRRERTTCGGGSRGGFDPCPGRSRARDDLGPGHRSHPGLGGGASRLSGHREHRPCGHDRHHRRGRGGFPHAGPDHLRTRGARRLDLPAGGGRVRADRLGPRPGAVAC